MDTPPSTPLPLAVEWAPPGYLDTTYWDFAYENKGPFCLYKADVSTTSAKTFAQLLSGPLVEVKVGKIKDSLKTKNGEIDLFELDPKAFELFVKWLYQGSIDDVSAIPMDEKWDYCYICQQLYIFCDEIDVPALKNLAIDQFRRGCLEAGLVPGVEEMVPIYQKTDAASPFRRLVSDIAARQIMDPDTEADSSVYRDAFQCTPEFAIDVINAIKSGVGGILLEDPTSNSGCYYHDHLTGERCNG